MRPIRSKTIVLLLTSAILATSLTGCQDGEEQQAGEILIGADLELSGVAAPLGQAYQRALELKIEQLNSSGGLGGRKIRLEVKDNRSDPSESSRNIGDFTADPALSAIIIGSCSECAVAAAKTLNDQKVPAIALAPAGAVASPVASRRYLFKLGPNAADSAAVLVTELKRRKAKKVALLHTGDDYGREGKAALKAELDKAEITLSKTGEVKPTDTDVSSTTRTVLKTEPDALVVWTSAEQATLVAAAAEDREFDGLLLFDAGAAGGLFLGGDAGRSAEDATMVFTQTMVIDDVIATTPAKAARKQWFRDYTARYGGYYGFSSFAADAVTMIADAAMATGSNADSVNREQLRDVLETLQLEGLSGPIRMTPDNHSGLMPQALTVLVARDGRWRLAG